MSETGVAPEVVELRALVAELASRVEDLDTELGSLKAQLYRHHPAEEVPEAVVLAISAAVAAYLGKRAKVKRVQVRRGSGWAAQARSDIHHSHRVR